MSTTTLTPRHQSTGPRHRLGQAPDQHHARAIIHRLHTEERAGAPRPAPLEESA